MAELDFQANVASQNFIINHLITANGTPGQIGQIIVSGGPSSNVYWTDSGGTVNTESTSPFLLMGA